MRTYEKWDCIYYRHKNLLCLAKEKEIHFEVYISIIVIELYKALELMTL